MSGTEGGTQELLKDFLRTYKDEQGSLSYRDKIRRFPLDGATSLNVDFQDLITFNVVFQDLNGEPPSQFLEFFDSALQSVLRIEAADYYEKLDKSLIKTRIVNYKPLVPLRAIRARNIGELIHISGIMMRASEVKPLLVHATFKCRRCGEKIVLSQEDGHYMEPDQCPVCGKKTPVSLIPEESKFRDWQKVRIQESPDELPPGSMPRSIDVILEGDIVDMSRPGDLVKITGILMTTPDFSRRGGRLATYNIYIQANGVEIAEKEYEQVELTQDDREEIAALQEDPYVHERIYRSIAPSIQGHYNIKESIALLLFGGVAKDMLDGTKLRGKSNILIVGDPGTGKSQILKFVSKLASRGLYTSGKGTTAAGLTAAVIHDTDTGAMTLEAGALVLADQGVACIDEFDKMDPNDRTAIHEAMEQHTVSIAKAGIVATLNARTSILAAANPVLGRYEPSRSIQDNIKLPFTILSRFDLTWILVDTVEEKSDRQIAQFILDMHQTGSIPTREGEKPPLSPNFLKKYIGHAQQHVIPELTSEAAEVIENFYVGLRKGAEGGKAPVPITARQLEALVRLAESRARMALQSKVSKEDAEAAIRLLEASLQEVAFDSGTGTYDIDRMVSSMSASQRTASDNILKVMEDFKSSGIAIVEVEDLITRVIEDMGVPRERVVEAIEKLTEQGMLFTPSHGKLGLVS